MIEIFSDAESNGIPKLCSYQKDHYFRKGNKKE